MAGTEDKGNAKSSTIVVVDDDAEIRDVVNEYLSGEGYFVYEAESGAKMWELTKSNVPDVVLLDLKLPGDDGFTLARQLRQEYPSVGILIISAKEDVVDRVAGLEVGADDYLTKPFHLRELLARVRSVLRRREQDEVPEATPDRLADASGFFPTPPKPGRFYFAEWILDADGRSLAGEDGKPVSLTTGEFDLLLAFATHPKRALSRDQLLDLARSPDAENFDRSIDVQVGRLRRKIERNPKRPALIKTIRNVGYMLDVDVKATNDRSR